MSVTIGKVETFPDAKPDKAQILKVLEECAEVFAAWQQAVESAEIDKLTGQNLTTKWAVNDLIYECADLIQATSNLLAGLGVDDMTDAMEQCRMRNVERGRYGEQ